MQFSAEEIALAHDLKHRGLAWEPAVGNYVFDTGSVVGASSPFQDRVYFLLNYDCFMRKVGGVDRFKEVMTWLPTWDDARQILRSLQVDDKVIEGRLHRLQAFRHSSELRCLYEMISEQLELNAERALAKE